MKDCKSLGDKKVKNRGNFSYIAIISLIIALVGGVPGILSVWNYFNRSSVKIMFDEKESLGCVIKNSQKPDLDGKLALLLYGVTIVGKGNQKFVAYDVNVQIYGNGKWYKGIRFYPVQKEIRKKNGQTSNAIRILVGPLKLTKRFPMTSYKRVILVHDSLYICDWHNFEPGISVGFGEPKTFMLAVYFPRAPVNLSIYDRLKIVVRDYIGNAYSETLGLAGIKRCPYVLYLDQSLSRK